MITNQVIQKTIDDVSAISKMEFYVTDGFGLQVAQTGSLSIDKETVLDFLQSSAQSLEIGKAMLFKVMDEEECAYVLAAQGEEDLFLIGKIVVSQLQNLIVAYKDRVDRNSFFQNLLLDNLLLVDIYNRAQKLHIEAVQSRAVFVIEVKSKKDVDAMEMVKELFYTSRGDFVTSVDERFIIVIKALEQNESYETLQETAEMLIDMLNSEAMTNARVAYGTIVDEIKGLSKSYKEAKMALDVAGIFYAEKSIIAYNTLGIGRLIYQLPVNLCQIFIREIFGEDIPEEIDEEMLNTVNKFFENSLNVSETSRQLFIHRNTLMYRIEKLQKATGLDIRTFDDALTFKIALMVVNYMKFIREND
ncbi:MAG: helix-turn-helix domain-containing protein [Lachnospiraceae bacterium]|nr:helix-turn-helix domain-containing protein [Lachnospiraceae bacterium]